jgi:hypothetical protein
VVFFEEDLHVQVRAGQAAGCKPGHHPQCPMTAMSSGQLQVRAGGAPGQTCIPPESPKHVEEEADPQVALLRGVSTADGEGAVTHCCHDLAFNLVVS